MFKGPALISTPLHPRVTYQGKRYTVRQQPSGTAIYERSYTDVGPAAGGGWWHNRLVWHSARQPLTPLAQAILEIANER